MNPAFLRITGFTRAQLTGLTLVQFDNMLRDCCDPTQTYQSATADPSAPTEAGGERRCAMRRVLPLVRPGKRTLQYSVHVGDGNARVLYFRDITHEAQVERLKSEFLSTAAHELRNPMASVFGFSELLLTRDYDKKTRKDLLSTIHRQAGHVINLLNELLDLARIEARAGRDFKFKFQPLAPIIQRTVKASRTQRSAHDRCVSAQGPADGHGGR